MYKRREDSKNSSKNRKALVSAYLAVVTMSVAVTITVMAGIEGRGAVPAEPSLYAVWTIVAGAIGGGVSLFAARGWLGQSGAMGYARAFVGCLVATLTGAVMAGVLIMPVYGAIYAPVFLITEFTESPPLAIIWVAVYLGVHYLMVPQAPQQTNEYQASKTRFANPGLSPLTRAQLYHRD
jgi:hypothetical protein